MTVVGNSRPIIRWWPATVLAVLSSRLMTLSTIGSSSIELGLVTGHSKHGIQLSLRPEVMSCIETLGIAYAVSIPFVLEYDAHNMANIGVRLAL